MDLKDKLIEGIKKILAEKCEDYENAIICFICKEGFRACFITMPVNFSVNCLKIRLKFCADERFVSVWIIDPLNSL